jgi:hypothetical protein
MRKTSPEEKIEALFFAFPAEYFLLAIGYLRGEFPASRELPLRLNAMCCAKKYREK